MNVALDLNGMRCQTELKFFVAKIKTHKVEEHIMCHRTPTVVGHKAVFVRPNVKEFLRQLSDVAKRMVVWSLMMRRNATLVNDHLFYGCHQPYEVLERESCMMIEVSKRNFFQVDDKIDLARHLLDVVAPFGVQNTGCWEKMIANDPDMLAYIAVPKADT